MVDVTAEWFIHFIVTFVFNFFACLFFPRFQGSSHSIALIWLHQAQHKATEENSKLTSHGEPLRSNQVYFSGRILYS